MKKNQIILIISATLLIGLGLGWLLFSSNEVHVHDTTVETSETIYTCSMHPQIRQGEPGDCPICGMELIPVGKVESGPDIISMSERARKLANIQTTMVQSGKVQKSIDLQGKVEIDEGLIKSQTSHISGRIEDIGINFTGETVTIGQPLARIYSPDLISAQKELLEAARFRDSSPGLYEAARRKLQSWKLTNSQIDEIENRGDVVEEIEIRAEISGIVIKKNVSIGNYLKPGDVLFEIADLSSVWVSFDAYESHLAWIRPGDSINFTFEGIPGASFSETIDFIDPVVDPLTRTAAVRVNVENSTRRLKPMMFANGNILSTQTFETDPLLVPKSAVLWTGKRSVVYVALQNQDESLYQFREIDLGEDLGDAYAVSSGLSEGEYVVTHGVFKVDAAAQLAGKKSMMNPEGNMHENVQTDHNHGDHSDHEPGSFEVLGNCEMCKERIEGVTADLDGMYQANWDVDSKLLTFVFDEGKIKQSQIGILIANAGHDNEWAIAPNDVYDDLPGCCQYDRRLDQ